MNNILIKLTINTIIKLVIIIKTQVAAKKTVVKDANNENNIINNILSDAEPTIK